MTRLGIATAGLVGGGFLLMSSAASALMLGNTTKPSGATPGGCAASVVNIQTATDATYDYSVPAGGGSLVSWSTNTAGDTSGNQVTMVVLRPNGATYTVVGVDAETIPTPMPASGIATFSMAQPIAVAAGDVLGLYSSVLGYNCAFTGGTIPVADVVRSAGSPTAPTVGAQYVATGLGTSDLLNVAANLAQSQDLAVSGTATPSSIKTGGAAEYSFTVTNGGPGINPVTFTDIVPAGLKILSAVAGSGSCSTAGQSVTCTISSLASGSTAPVSIIVSAASAGTYSDTATVSSSLPDSTPADNTAKATLTVSTSAVSCKTITLAGAPLAVAKAAIPALNCKVGKTTKKASKKVRKRYVITTSPGPGKTLTAGTTVNIVVSSGPPKRKKAKKKK